MLVAVRRNKLKSYKKCKDGMSLRITNLNRFGNPERKRKEQGVGIISRVFVRSRRPRKPRRDLGWPERTRT